ncbi:50S ribosomal protein L10 [bacterium]|nr:50S ribosomal protein L10 [bacterium]
MDRNQKEELVRSLHERFERARLVVRVGFSGLTVAKMNELRREVEKAKGASLAVLKNTLAHIASRDTGNAPLFEDLEGPNAFLIVDDDPVVPSKTIVTFAKANDKFTIKDGMFDGRLVTEAQVRAIADLPSREELLARLLYVMNGPQRNFVQVLAAVPRSFLNVLNAIKDQKDGAAAA